MRLDQLDENQLAATIEGLERELDELKNRQFVGTTNIELKLSENPVAYDINGVAIAPYEIKRFRIVFTPTIPKPVYAEITSGGFFSGTPTGFATVERFPDPDNVDEDNFRAWIQVFANDANAVTYFTKFTVRAPDTGVITWSAL